MISLKSKKKFDEVVLNSLYNKTGNWILLDSSLILLKTSMENFG